MSSSAVSIPILHAQQGVDRDEMLCVQRALDAEAVEYAPRRNAIRRVGGHEARAQSADDLALPMLTSSSCPDSD